MFACVFVSVTDCICVERFLQSVWRRYWQIETVCIQYKKRQRWSVCYTCGLLFPLFFFFQINQRPQEVNPFPRKHGMVVWHGSLAKKMVYSEQCDCGFLLRAHIFTGPSIAAAGWCQPHIMFTLNLLQRAKIVNYGLITEQLNMW